VVEIDWLLVITVGAVTNLKKSPIIRSRLKALLNSVMHEFLSG
jgi:hypothetical protein